MTREFADMILLNLFQTFSINQLRLQATVILLLIIFSRTNDTDDIVLNGRLYFDISDHMATFVITKLSRPTTKAIKAKKIAQRE